MIMKRQRTLRHIFILLACSLFVIHSSAQELTRAINLEREDVNEEELEQVQTLAARALEDYNEAASLYDPIEYEVNEAAKQRFTDLFNLTARVIDDYNLRPSDNLDPEDYAFTIAEFFSEGHKFSITSPVLKSVRKEAGYFIARVELIKTVFNYIDENGRAQEAESGIRHELAFEFEVDSRSMDQAYISRIEFGAEAKISDELLRLVSVNVALGSTNYDVTYSKFWNDNHKNNTLDPSSGLNMSFGIEYLSNRFIHKVESSNKALFWSAGLNFSRYSLKNDLRSFEIDHIRILDGERDDTNWNLDDDYDRKIKKAFADEDVIFNTIELPLGVGYVIGKGQFSLFTLQAKFIPGLILSSSGSLKGDIVYGADFLIDGEPTNFTIDRENVNGNEPIPNDGPNTDHSNSIKDVSQLGENNAFAPFELGYYNLDQNINEIEDNESILSSYVFGFQVSPKIHLSILGRDNPGWGLSIGLDLGYQFSSFYEHNTINDRQDTPLQFSDESSLESGDQYNGSLLSYYTEDLTGFRFGISIGLFQRYSENP